MEKHHSSLKITALGIFFIALLPSLPLFIKGIHLGHDWAFHFLRIESLAQGLQNGVFPIRLNSLLFNNHGYPASIFYGDLLLYFPALLRLIHIAPITTYKIYILFINVLSVAIAYFSFYKISKSERCAWFASAAYVCAHYRLLDIYIRSALGEYTAIAFFPLIAWALWRIYVENKTNFHTILLLSFSMLVLLYTHILSTQWAAFFIILTALFFYKKTFTFSVLKVYFHSFLIFIFIGASFIIPFLDYYFNTQTNIRFINEHVRYNLQDTGVFPADYFAVFHNPFGEHSLIVNQKFALTPGFLLILVLIYSVYLIIQKKAQKTIQFFAFFSIFLLFLASDIFPWRFFTHPLLTSLQAPMRILGFAILFLALLFCFVLKQTKKQNDFLIASILLTTHFAFLSHYFDHAQNEIPTLETMQKKHFADEYLFLGLNSDTAKETFQVQAHNMKIHFLKEKGVDLHLNVQTDGQAYVDLPRFNYPYYVAHNHQGQLFSLSDNHNFRLRLLIPMGYEGDVFIRFSPPFWWRMAEFISLFSLLFVCWKIFKKNRG